MFPTLYLISAYPDRFCLAWLYVYKKWPEDCIDHINHIRTDNRIENLREVEKSQNQKNMSKDRRNKSGHSGVIWYKAYEKWSAEIWVNKVKHFLGYFENFEDAVLARKAAEERHGFHENHGK